VRNNVVLDQFSLPPSANADKHVCERLRPDLAPRDRSLVTISALIANGQVAQLTGHIPIGMNNGLTQPEIAEAITHLAFFVGWPNVFSAMPVAKDVFEKRAR
jgi:4-carboxymuconolactone decarboxylase